MDFLEVHGKKMRSFNNLINSLQKSITENKPISLIANSLLNQRILYLLQINGYIEGFKILNPRQIVVILNISQV